MTHSEPHKEFVTATAITSLIALAGVYLPVFGVVASLFLPLPVLFYRSKLGRSWGALILIAVTLIVATMMGWRSIPSAVFFFELGLVGLVLSEMFAMNVSLEKTVAVTTGVVIASGALMLAVYGLVSTKSLWGLVSDYLHQNLELVLAMYRDMDGSDEGIVISAESVEGIHYVMLRLMPAVVIVSTLFVVWSNLLLARPLLQSRRLFCPDFGTLNKWRAPESLVWVAIGAGILLLVPHEGVKLFGVNGLLVMMMIYFFQGIAICSFYFEKKQFPRLLRTVLYGLIALQQVILLLVIAVGFFDIWVDFRRMKKGVDNENESNTERDD
ncbi:MAG: YybS family protein [Thermodesulfobacteriota bacterium]|nr:YybS family protein [Thermodesulfobacteriota bacterium]